MQAGFVDEKECDLCADDERLVIETARPNCLELNLRIDSSQEEVGEG